jgi:MoaA/NifB/PqqE/SkfB family radical SAM enzyme
VVEVSVYSVNDKRMREVYGASGDRPAEVVLNNVLRLKEMGLPVVCKTFLNTVTTQDFDEIVLWCDTNNVEHSSSSDLTPAYDGTDLSEFKIDGRESERLAILNEGQRNICFPCGTKNYGCAIMPAFEVCPCPSIMHRDCYFDLRQLGVRESLRRMVAFMRRFQDSEIVEATNGTARHKTCIAFSEPVRNDGGEILHFAKSRT